MKAGGPEIKLVAFDVFGTVVDWHGTIAREVDELGLGISGSQVARAWRARYKPTLQKVANGDLAWTPLDELHRLTLEEVLAQFEVESLGEQQKCHLNQVWHRLEPWPDSVEGLSRLKSRYKICTLSNGNLSLLTELSRHAELPWDSLLSAEIFRKYKPDPDVYLGAADMFNLNPEEVMLAAAHPDDLFAAGECRLQTAYIERPEEYGSAEKQNVPSLPAGTLCAGNINHLADLLGC